MKFEYQARDKEGQTQMGVVEASSREVALQLLEHNGLFVTILEESKNKPFYGKRLNIFEKVGAKDLMVFARQLSIMFKAKVPLVQALQTLGQQTKNPLFKEKIVGISEQVEAGTSLSESLKTHSDLFTPFFISMVKSGEASGTLSDVLEYLAEHIEREYYLAGKIKGAMVYPAFILATTLIVLFLMMFFVLPNLTKILVESGQELPFLTKIVIGATSIVRSWWWAMFLLLIGGFMGLSRYRKTPEGSRTWNTFLLKIPVLSPFLRMIYLSRFAENLSTLIGGGLPIVQALDITGDIMGNEVYQDIVREAKDEVRKGNKISQVLEKHPTEFPPMFKQMVFVGEQSGALDTTLLNTVEFYQKEVERTVEGFLGILEPLMIVVLGVMVGGLVASILLPLYQTVLN